MGKSLSNLELRQGTNLRIDLPIGSQCLLSHDRPGPVLQISQVYPGAGVSAFAAAAMEFVPPWPLSSLFKRW